MNKMYKIFIMSTIKVKFITFLFEYQKRDIQFGGKAGTKFSIRLSNHH